MLPRITYLAGIVALLGTGVQMTGGTAVHTTGWICVGIAILLLLLYPVIFKTYIQIFKKYLDERIKAGKSLQKEKDLTPQMCADWLYKTKKGVETALGSNEVENSFHWGNFYPPMFTEKELKKKLWACIDETEQVKNWATSPKLLPTFDPRDLDEYR